MIELPKPAAFRTRYRSEPGMIGNYPWTYACIGRRKIDSPGFEGEDLFTADQLRTYGDQRAAEARADALQALERVPMTTADMVNVVKAAGWPTDTNDRQLVAAFNLIEETEAHHGITPPESKG